MLKLPSLRVAAVSAALVLAALGAWQTPARAQAAQTPQQIQGLIASGQDAAALNALKPVLAAHPDSGIAWYLTAEAQDASGNEVAARAALAKAQQLSPGLPFADQSKAAALQAHLAQTQGGTARSGLGGFSVSPAVLVIGGLIVLFLVMRFFRARRNMAYPANYPSSGYGGTGYPPGAPPPYGPGYGPGMGMGGGMGMGSGIGGAIVGGLAAGAGFAAGERVIDGMMGGGQPGIGMPGGGVNGPVADNNGLMPAPDRDDGLLGQPGWDNQDAFNNDPGSFDSGSDDSNGGGW